MNITILNGNPAHSGFDDYLSGLKKILEGDNHQVTQLDARAVDPDFHRLTDFDHVAHRGVGLLHRYTDVVVPCWGGNLDKP